MRRAWTAMIAMLLAATVIMYLTGDADGLEATIEEDEYYVSVDPTDDEQGVLEIHGTVDPGDLRFAETVTVDLSVVIHELQDGEDTGRTWYADVAFDDSSIAGSSNVFRKGDGPETFTIDTDPSNFDPARDEGIPVPTELDDSYEGRVLLTVSYSGTGGVSSGEDILQTSIYPELYHLVTLSTPDDPVSMRASYSFLYSLSIRNKGNMVENINIEVPLLEQLEDLGFETDLQNDYMGDVGPGESFISNLSLEAPREIKRNDTYDLVIRAYTDAVDPDTLDPASSSEVSIEMTLIKSRIDDPSFGDDDDDTNDDGENGNGEPFNPTPGQDPMATDEEAEPWMVVLAIGFIIVILLILILLFFRKKGEGQEEDIEDTHSSMVRI